MEITPLGLRPVVGLRRPVASVQTDARCGSVGVTHHQVTVTSQVTVT